MATSLRHRIEALEADAGPVDAPVVIRVAVSAGGERMPATWARVGDTRYSRHDGEDSDAFEARVVGLAQALATARNGAVSLMLGGKDSA